MITYQWSEAIRKYNFIVSQSVYWVTEQSRYSCQTKKDKRRRGVEGYECKHVKEEERKGSQGRKSRKIRKEGKEKRKD